MLVAGYTRASVWWFKYACVWLWARVSAYVCACVLVGVRVCVPVCIQNLEEADIILFPINISNAHWCLAAVYPKEKSIRYVCVCVFVHNGSGTGSRLQKNMFENNSRFTRGRLHRSQKPASVYADRHLNFFLVLYFPPSILLSCYCRDAGTLTPWGVVMGSASILCRCTKEKNTSLYAGEETLAAVHFFVFLGMTLWKVS
jgi:hypothetical protein